MSQQQYQRELNRTQLPTLWTIPEKMWQKIRPLLPPEKEPGTPGRTTPVPFRKVMNGRTVDVSCRTHHLPTDNFGIGSWPNPRLRSAGSVALGPYVVDKGFEGAENHRRWLDRYGARLICPPKRNARSKVWPKPLRRWVAGIRQIVESVYDKLFNAFGLWQERPHELSGLRARLAARIALHNFCIWLNDQLGRPRLAFADLLGW
jgi:hypothetical protein